MSNTQKLALVRLVHTAIYILMAASTFVLLYAGLSGRSGTWLYVALVLLVIEVVVFFGNGMRCPLTAIAVRYGADTGGVLDTFLPERITRNTFWFFGNVMMTGLILLVLRWFGFLA